MYKLHLLPAYVLILLLSACTTSQAPLRPNIIFFLVDDLGWQDTSLPFGKEKSALNKRYHTPNMERLAREGMKFTQAYASSVCSPTRASLISGMNAARHRVTNWTLRRNVSTDDPLPDLELPPWNLNGVQPVDSIERSTYISPLPQLLRAQGYHTIHCGKAHFGAEGTPGADPLQLGFDVNIAGHAAGGLGSHLGIHNFSAAWRGGDRIWDVPGMERYHGKDISLSEALTQEALSALDSALGLNKPFYLYMSHYTVHAPLEADSRYIAPYLERGMDEVEARYASMVEGMDKSLGDLMDYLERKGIADQTLIVFLSDNGGLSAVSRGGEAHTHNKPLASGKGSAYEGGIRVPLLVKWPGTVEPASICDEYLIAEDFFPTLLEMAGIRNYKTVQQVDGISFVPLLRGAKITERQRALYWHFPNSWGPRGPGIGPSSSIRQGDWKLIYYHQDQHMELFNLEQDLEEEHNLAANYPDKVRELAQQLGAYLRAVQAQMPLNKSNGRPVPYPG